MFNDNSSIICNYICLSNKTKDTQQTCRRPSFATATISDVRQVKDLKNMDIILARRSEWFGVLKSVHAIVVQSSSMQPVLSLVNDVATLGFINFTTHTVSSASAICNASWRKFTNSWVNLRRGGLNAKMKFKAVTVPTYKESNKISIENW